MLAFARLAAGGPVGGGGEGPVAHSEKEKEKENLGRDVSPQPRRVHLLLGVCLAGWGVESLSPCRQPATTEGGSKGEKRGRLSPLVCSVSLPL